MATKQKNGKVFWYKDAIIYELSVRAFCDSNGDGIGDFPGIIQKLEYLEDLGINTIWLLPFYPSPMRDYGYDVSDYCDVNPDYGTLSDFRSFLKEAHRKGIHVITELILNHTSDEHPWFRKARKSRQNSRARDFYVWSDNNEKYADARIIIPGERPSNWAWDQEAEAYYWTRFGRYLPELNYDNPEVQIEIIKVADFWLKLGVDGFRLSSIPFLFEQEGTSCENLPQTHAFVRKLRAHVEKNYDDRILIAEANLWPEDAASYFGDGDESHMSFHYPLMPRLFLSLRTEDNYPIVDIIAQTPEIPETGQWALFLRNHDELALEMVTDEEKDYLFKAYANDPNTKFNVGINRRLAPLLNNDRRKIELLYAVLFSLPGSPVIYYGDEIGMGDNVYLRGRAGVRTPMQWNMNINAGFSTANPQKLYLPVITDPLYRFESVNVKTQEENPSSLVLWIKNIVAMRKRINAFARGAIKFIESSNSKILCFARLYEKQRVIVVANLSQFSQAATLDLSGFKDCDITEAFSQNRFKSIDEGEYDITIGPYGYFWFEVDISDQKNKVEASGELAVFESDLSWERIFNNYNEARVIERKILPVFMKKCRWFGGKAKVISKLGFHKIVPLKVGDDTHYLTIVEVHYVQRLPELYFVPMTFVLADQLMDKAEYTIQGVICRAEIQDDVGFIIDSSYNKAFRDYLFTGMHKNMELKEHSDVIAFKSSLFSKLKVGKAVESKLLKSDQSNTAIIYNDQYFLKFYRKIEKEINPDLEIIRFLSEKTNFRNSPKYAGSIELRDEKGGTYVMGLMQEKVEHQGDAWTMTVDSLGRFYERVLMNPERQQAPPLINQPVLRFDQSPPLIQELIGRGFYERIVRLAQRTAEMHLALASDKDDPAFAPESFNTNYQRSLYSSLRKLVRDRFGLLESALPKLRREVQVLGRRVLAMEDDILQCFSEIYKIKINAVKTRIHGDYHLGQVLFTGKDFIIIDFEGEPGFSFSERRLKKNPLKDVAGMMRSIHYAAFGKIMLNENYREQDREVLEVWADQWQHYIARFYLGAYIDRFGKGTTFSHENDILLQTYLLEKAVYELGYELNGRPDWVIVPLRGIEYHMKRYMDERQAQSASGMAEKK
jgi:maltose alpha-D-glucosyltransferase / alpha-amylase